MDSQQGELIENEVVINNDPSGEEAVTVTPAAPTEHAFRAPVAPVHLNGSTPETIRADIDRTRAQMDATIDRLSERLRPRHLIDDVVRLFQAGGEETEESAARRTMREAGLQAADKLKQNPVPATLIGAGLAWLLFQDRSRRRAASSYDPYMAGPAEGGSVGSAARLERETPAQSSAAFTQAKSAAGNLLESAPLALGVGALAAGLLTGLVLPETRVEKKLSREASDKLDDSPLASGRPVAQPYSKADRLWDR